MLFKADDNRNQETHNMSANLFDFVVPKEKVHPNLQKILPQPGGEDFHGPTRDALQEAFERLPNPDNNFAKDFQSTGFDGRVWELYLSEMMHSVGLSVTQPHDRPDFLAQDTLGNSVWVEAVTANPSQVSAEPSCTDTWQEQDDLAIKLGGPLFDKIKKRYWELPWVGDVPLVLAIADFHDDAPGFRVSAQPLERYAYGIHARLTSSVGEDVAFTEEAIAQHVGRKTIPSGFFDMPGSEHVSALLFSNAGTVAKFSRIGFAKHPIPGMIIARFGTEYDDDPKAIMPKPFYYFIDEYPERWNEEAVVLHNPNALHPLPSQFFGNTAEDRLEGGKLKTFYFGDFIFNSTTQKLLCEPYEESYQRARLEAELERWAEKYYSERDRLAQQVINVHKQYPPAE